MHKFDFNTIEDFDKHIGISIPNYNHIWELIHSLSTYFIQKDSNVYDIGCSTGAGLKLLNFNTKVENVKFIGYDISENLLSQNHNTSKLHLINQDITDENLHFDNASLILSIFTLQFIDPRKVDSLLKRIYEGINQGGVFILAEKVYRESGLIQDIFTFSYYDFKSKSFGHDEIFNKQFDLRAIMKNQTESKLFEKLNGLGFRYIDSFFQSLLFKGWICIK